jgi:post-segregation antitoxin (ccd killing protein)
MDVSMSNETQRVTITLPKDLYEQIKQKSVKNDRTISAQIANMLKKVIDTED